MYNPAFAIHRLKQQWKQNNSTASPTSSTISRSARPSFGGIFDYDQKRERLTLLNLEMEDPKIWDDAKRAQELGREKKSLEDIVLILEEVEAGLTDGRELFDMGKEEGDDDTLLSVQADNAALEAKIAALEFRRMFNNPSDPMPCFLEIQAGAGGTEAQDWTEMLLRMYARWAEQHGYKTEMLDENGGEEAGLKSATIQIKGQNAYGWLKTESGVHRLVRISPYDSNARRHTSFSSVAVTPVIDDSIAIEVNEADLKVDVYRASGAGGQHVNKTESAVRFTHIPTGIVVACQQERSQHKNRAKAMEMLKAKLYEMELKKREAAADALEAQKTDIGWGHQIRSYVLQPYQMVKDQRTGVENSQAQAVLDGDLDMFLQASLAARIKGHSEEV